MTERPPLRSVAPTASFFLTAALLLPTRKRKPAIQTSAPGDRQRLYLWQGPNALAIMPKANRPRPTRPAD